jgi:hypothetical protein
MAVWRSVIAALALIDTRIMHAINVLRYIRHSRIIGTMNKTG